MDQSCCRFGLHNFTSTPRDSLEPCSIHQPRLDFSYDGIDAALAFQPNFPEEDLYSAYSQSASPSFLNEQDRRSSTLSNSSTSSSDSNGSEGRREDIGLSPQKVRRRAQNRAAQRAFRDRKEKQLSDLQGKLRLLEEQSSLLYGENERLRREMASITVENEVLRSISGI